MSRLTQEEVKVVLLGLKILRADCVSIERAVGSCFADGLYDYQKEYLHLLFKEMAMACTQLSKNLEHKPKSREVESYAD